MRRLQYGGLLFALASLALGCSERLADFENVPLRENPLERHVRIAELTCPTNVVYFDVDALSNDAIIVSVNGYPFYKKDFNEMMLVDAKAIAQDKRHNELDSEKILEDKRKGYIRHFVAQRLLVDDAIASGVVTTNEVREQVKKSILAVAEKRHRKVSEIVKLYGEHGEQYLYELALNYAMSREIGEKIPPLACVDDQFVSNIQAQVALQNAEAGKTNAMLKARLEGWRQQILSRQVEFAVVARMYYQTSDQNEKLVAEDGVWGEFEAGAMDNPEVDAAVFALPSNGVSKVIEDDDSLRIVKVLEILPEQQDESGHTIVKERRKLSQIYLEKEPMLLVESDKIMRQDLKWQMQQQAINQFVLTLMTNGSNRVEYPHGVPRL